MAIKTFLDVVEILEEPKFGVSELKHVSSCYECTLQTEGTVIEVSVLRPVDYVGDEYNAEFFITLFDSGLVKTFRDKVEDECASLFLSLLRLEGVKVEEDMRTLATDKYCKFLFKVKKVEASVIPYIVGKLSTTFSGDNELVTQGGLNV